MLLMDVLDSPSPATMVSDNMDFKKIILLHGITEKLALSNMQIIGPRDRLRS